MKRILALLMFLVPMLIHAQLVINDENAQERKVGAFTSIRISNAIDLFLTQGNEDGIAVSATEAEYRDNIKTTVEDGVLRISYDEGSKFWGKSGNKKLKAYVSVRNLRALTASGASDVRITGVIKGEELTFNFSGASDFRGNVDVNILNVDLSGASDVMISGRAETLKISASGASDFKGYDLKSDNCNARANGASDIQITVNKELNATASGASGVYYKGTGVIRDIKSSGASSISKRG